MGIFFLGGGGLYVCMFKNLGGFEIFDFGIFSGRKILVGIFLGSLR